MGALRPFQHKALGDPEVPRLVQVHFNVNGGPFGVHECMVDIMGGLPEQDWRLVQRDGVDVRVERQCRQTCVAMTRSRLLARCSSTFDHISSGSLLTGINVFLVTLVVCKTPQIFRLMSRPCES